MARIDIGVKEGHGDARNIQLFELLRQRLDFRALRQLQCFSRGVHAFADFEAQGSRNQRGIAAEEQIEGFGTVATAQFQHIAKAARGDQRNSRPRAFQQGVDN